MRCPLAVRLTVEQHLQHVERLMFPQAEVALAEQLENLRDERQALNDQLLGSLVVSGRGVLAPRGRPWHHVSGTSSPA